MACEGSHRARAGGQADRYAYERQGNHARGLHGAPPEDEGGGKQTTAPVRDLEELSVNGQRQGESRGLPDWILQLKELSVISLQVQILQQDCQELRKDVQLARVRLQEEEERTAHLEQQGKQLKAELGMPNAQLSFSKQHKENLQLQSKMTALRGTAEKVQVMRIDTLVFKMEIKYNKSDYSRTRKDRKLQEQDSLLNADHVKILRELQSVQHERAQLQRRPCKREHGQHRQKASLAEEAETTQRQLLECTDARLQGELGTALQEKGSLLAEMKDLQWELEMVSMKFTLQTLEEENKRLLDHLVALVHEQEQVQQVLAELTNNKNKLTCDKGKLQVANLQHQLDMAKNGHSKATAMLEHVLASRNKIQEALEVVRTELGHKDTEIGNLRKDRLETELEHYQAMEKQHSSHVKLLCKTLESAKADNKTLVLSLEEVLHLNNTLQSKLIQTQYELKSKETEHQQLTVCREQLMEKAKTEEKMYTEHLESLKK
ncbi:unnamed protein product [Bubo scandiacus]